LLSAKICGFFCGISEKQNQDLKRGKIKDKRKKIKELTKNDHE